MFSGLKFFFNFFSQLVFSLSAPQRKALRTQDVMVRLSIFISIAFTNDTKRSLAAGGVSSSEQPARTISRAI